MGIKFDNSGAKKISGKLDRIKSDLQNIPIASLFPELFMRQNTKHSNISDFLSKSRIAIDERGNIDDSDVPVLDNYVRTNTRFRSWEEFMQSAVADYMKRNIGV